MPLREVILVVGIVATPLAGVVIWFARLGILLKQGVERLTVFVADEQIGLLTTVRHNYSETQRAIGALSNEHKELGERISKVEARCGTTHGSP